MRREEGVHVYADNGSIMLAIVRVGFVGVQGSTMEAVVQVYGLGASCGDGGWLLGGSLCVNSTVVAQRTDVSTNVRQARRRGNESVVGACAC